MPARRVRSRTTRRGRRTINRVPDASATDLDALFEAQWRKNLFTAALDRVKEKFSLKQFQIFDLVVLKEWPSADVAKSFGVSLANVYVTKHRISAALKKEMARIEREMEQRVKSQNSSIVET
jgi:RNA polymerase sigma-70 factor (ECF subfamily)